jgi:hypothetical protein
VYAYDGKNLREFGIDNKKGGVRLGFQTWVRNWDVTPGDDPHIGVTVTTSPTPSATSPEQSRCQ